MIVTISDHEITQQKVLNEKRGRIQAQIDVIESCVKTIESETEYDIWFPAWEEVKVGTRHMRRILDSGGIR